MNEYNLMTSLMHRLYFSTCNCIIIEDVTAYCAQFIHTTQELAVKKEKKAIKVMHCCSEPTAFTICVVF